MFHQPFRHLVGATVAAVAAIGLMATPAMATPVTYDGVTFPGGDASFADAVISYSPGAHVSSPYNDPSNALGAPDYPNGAPSTGHVSLGWGGSLILSFTDNSLTTSGDNTDDLWIFEVGPQVEPMDVAISEDGIAWILVGSVGGATAGVDIDAFADVVAGTQYSYVRLTDLNTKQSNSPFAGADIDAVGAISSAPPVPDPNIPSVPEPGILALLGLALGTLAVLGRRRRV